MNWCGVLGASALLAHALAAPLSVTAGLEAAAPCPMTATASPEATATAPAPHGRVGEAGTVTATASYEATAPASKAMTTACLAVRGASVAAPAAPVAGPPSSMHGRAPQSRVTRRGAPLERDSIGQTTVTLMMLEFICLPQRA